MEQKIEIPDDVLEAPIGPDGYGFVVLGIQTTSIVGSDGKIYTRKGGKISVMSEDKESV